MFDGEFQAIADKIAQAQGLLNLAVSELSTLQTRVNDALSGQGLLPYVPVVGGIAVSNYEIVPSMTVGANGSLEIDENSNSTFNVSFSGGTSAIKLDVMDTSRSKLVTINGAATSKTMITWPPFIIWRSEVLDSIDPSNGVSFSIWFTGGKVFANIIEGA